MIEVSTCSASTQRGGISRCPANMADFRQSRPDSGLGFLNVLQAFGDVPSSLGSGSVIDAELFRQTRVLHPPIARYTLSSENGTNETATARFWPRLAVKIPSKSFELFHARSEAVPRLLPDTDPLSARLESPALASLCRHRESWISRLSLSTSRECGRTISQVGRGWLGRRLTCHGATSSRTPLHSTTVAPNHTTRCSLPTNSNQFLLDNVVQEKRNMAGLIHCSRPRSTPEKP